MQVASLVLILLLGLTVLVFGLGSPLFLILYIGLPVLLTLVILVFPFFELLILFEQWAGHRLLSAVPVSEGIEIRHGCQFLSSLVRAFAKLPGGLGRFVPCYLGSRMSRLRHLGWNQCSHGLSSRPLESCHHQCLKAVCGGFWGYPKGSALELLDGTLKLRHCITLFSTRFSPLGLYPGLEMGVVNGSFVLLDILLIQVAVGGKRVRLTKKTRPGVFSLSNPDPGHPTPRRWKRLRPLSSKGEGSEVGVPRNLCPRLGAG